MKRCARLAAMAAVMMATGAAWGQTTAPAAALYNVPKLENITIDGDGTDWGDKGFRVDIVAPIDADLRPASNHAARFRIGWCDKGILLLATVQDDQWVENSSLGDMWQADCLELFMSTGKGKPDCGQWVISPGMNGVYKEPRWNFHEGRTGKLKELAKDPVVARKSRGNAYTMEVLLPFSALDIKPEMGTELGLQMSANDRDGTGGLYRAFWYPGSESLSVHDNVQRVRLRDHADAPVVARATAGYNMDFLRGSVSAVALEEQAGKSVRVLSGDGKVLATGKLAADNMGRAMVTLPLPELVAGQNYGEMTVEVEGKVLDRVSIATADQKRAEAFLHTVPAAKPSVFMGSSLPPLKLENPLYVERLIGPFEMSVSYYDASYNAVSSAEKPGRYGAVAEIKTSDGRVHRRFVTLFRTAKDFKWWEREMPVSVQWPEEVGVSAAAMAKHEEMLRQDTKWLLIDGIDRDSGMAVMLAGLYETGEKDPTNDFYSNAWNRDRQWWVGLKQKLYGTSRIFAKPLVGPTKVAGLNATVIHEGSLKEAAMKADAPEKIDAVLKEWSADTDEAFAVCIARNGVIVLHKAYGMRDGKPMTVTTKSEMASATKLMSGAMVATAIDQGILSLDDQPGKYLPPLTGLTGVGGKPMTIRHLYTHTSGVPVMWHWGAESSDMEERFADLMPTLNIGKENWYNGTGMELTQKILELASGKSLPQIYKMMYVEPMGLTDINLCNASYGTSASPLAVAKILQMVCNKGAYGEYRYFGEETYKQLIPQDQSAKTGVKTTYGLGTSPMDRTVLGPNTFGHGAASSATIRIDPDNKLVVVMTRNSAGKNFTKYHPRFLQAVADGMVDPVLAAPAAGAAAK